MSEENKEQALTPAQAPAAEPVKKEKPANCAKCNKALRKKQHYYRNGKFYCTKRCWKSTLQKGEKPEGPQQEAK